MFVVIDGSASAMPPPDTIPPTVEIAQRSQASLPTGAEHASARPAISEHATATLAAHHIVHFIPRIEASLLVVLVWSLQTSRGRRARVGLFARLWDPIPVLRGTNPLG